MPFSRWKKLLGLEPETNSADQDQPESDSSLFVEGLESRVLLSSVTESEITSSPIPEIVVVGSTSQDAAADIDHCVDGVGRAMVWVRSTCRPERVTQPRIGPQSTRSESPRFACAAGVLCRPADPAGRRAATLISPASRAGASSTATIS